MPQGSVVAETDPESIAVSVDVLLCSFECLPCIEALAVLKQVAISGGRRQIVRGGGVGAILRAMDAHPTSIGVQRGACATLLILAFLPIVQRLARQIIPRIDRAIDRHKFAMFPTAGHLKHLLCKSAAVCDV